MFTKESIIQHIIDNVDTNHSVLLQLRTDTDIRTNPNHETVPDNYIWEVTTTNKNRRMAIHNEKYIYYLSRIGYTALKNDIKNALIAYYNRYLKTPNDEIWNTFHQQAQDEIKNIVHHTIDFSFDLKGQLEQTMDNLKHVGLNIKQDEHIKQKTIQPPDKHTV